MSPRRTAWLVAAAFWALFGLFSGFQVYLSMITHGHSLPRLLGYHVAVWEVWLLPTVVIAWLARRWPVVPLQRLPVLIHVLAACVVAVLHGLWWLGLLLSVRPFDKMTPEASRLPVAELLLARFPFECVLYCLVLGSALAFEFYERYRERDVQAAQLETSLAGARLHALEQQIQPHFLFNTLNAVTSLVRNGRSDEAVAMMAGLGDLLRYALDHAGDQQVPLEEELAVVSRYLEIQRARFPDRMTFRIDAPPELRRGKVPAFLLQPLAENAVRHGIAASAAPGRVEVRAARRDGRLLIDVFSTGVLSETKTEGIGLKNTRERLRHLYGEEGRLELSNGDGGVLAAVSIPWSEAT
jgi:hypothetical protein